MRITHLVLKNWRNFFAADVEMQERVIRSPVSPI